MKIDPIIIVGGGIGGMTTALALAKKGMSTIVLEQAESFRELGAGILLCPNVFKIFDYLEINKPMMEIGSFPRNLIYADGITGFKYLNVPMGEEIVKRFHHPYVSVHREDLLKVLVNECKKVPLIELKTSAKVIEIVEKDDRVYAKTEHGQTFQGKALIGCDGLWSTCRKYILGEQRPRPSGHITHRGVARVEEMPVHLRSLNVTHWDLPDAHMVHYPIGNKGLFNIVAVYKTQKPETAEDPAGDYQELHERFKGALPEILEMLPKVDTSRKWMLYDREPVKVWSKGRMTLLGDSAHPTLPHLTQGAGMAIEDAVVIAETLDEYRDDPAKAFEQYQNRRFLRTGHVQIFSKAYGEIHHTDGVARELRNLLVSMRSLEENYQWLGMMYNGIDLPDKVKK